MKNIFNNAMKILYSMYIVGICIAAMRMGQQRERTKRDGCAKKTHHPHAQASDALKQKTAQIDDVNKMETTY